MRCRALLLAIPLCVFGTFAQATVLVTPSLNTTNVNNTLDCRIVNAGKKPIHVVVQIVNQEGVVIEQDEFDVPVGGARATQVTDTAVAASCRFSGKFGKKSVRTTVAVEDALLRTIAVAVGE